VILPFIVLGLATGAVYGLAAVGLVLTYKTSGIFNFAHGAMATTAAYVFYELYVQHQMSWILAAAITMATVSVVLGLFFERFARALTEASLVVQVVATIGVFLVVQSAIVLIYGDQEVRSVPQFLPTDVHSVFGVFVTESQMITFGFAVLVTGVLNVSLRMTRNGAAMRAVVDNPDLLDMAGTSPTRTRRSAWFIGVLLASASGILIAPQQADLSGVNLTLLVLAAFGAAAVGAFSSLPLTFLGGLAIGVGSALCSKYFVSGMLSGLAPTLPFVVLFVVLLVLPKRLLATKVVVRPRSVSDWTTPWQIQSAGGLVVLLVLLFVPSFAGVHLTAWTQTLTAVISFLALGLLSRTSGQVSLGHAGFLAIGACGLSHLAVDHGVPWGLALLLSGLIAVPVGAVLAIPAIRLSGLYLALATFGFGVLLAYLFYTADFMFGSTGAGLVEPRPRMSWLDLTSDRAYYYLVLAITIVVCLFVMAITRSRLGRLLRALADSPTALATGGTSTMVSQVLVFCLSAFLAAFAGALGGAAQGVVSGDSYSFLLSLSYLAVVMICVGREPWYALMAGAGLMLVPSYLTGHNVGNWLTLVFGASAMLLVVAVEGNQRMQQRAAVLLDPIFRRPGRRSVSPEPAIAAEWKLGKAPATVLRVDALRVAFGGLVAVDGVTLAAPSGTITGLIGPNGAGKTTTFNALSGLNRPSAGRVTLGGRDISRLGPAARARRGIGRTFQQMELYDSLTVVQNVGMGLESALAGANPVTQLVARRSDSRRVEAAAGEALELCGIAHLADRGVAGLSTGQRRLVELARCLAGDHSILLLDEPSSGLDKAETEAFGAILRKAVEERGVGILLVEHDMSLVMSACSRLYVLDFGRLVFEGTPAEARQSEVVRAAYLGDARNEEIIEAERQQEVLS